MSALRRLSPNASKCFAALSSAPATWSACTELSSSPSAPDTRLVASRLARLSASIRLPSSLVPVRMMMAGRNAATVIRGSMDAMT